MEVNLENLRVDHRLLRNIEFPSKCLRIEIKLEEFISKKILVNLVGIIFLKKKIGAKPRRFNHAWFSEFPTWLEYSIEKDR